MIDATDDKIIFWDAFGFADHNSGIYVHAKTLAEELSLIDISPVLFCLNTHLPGFKENTNKILVNSIFNNKIGKSKLLWPEISSLHIPKQQSKGQFIYHGLANINLPVLSNRRGKKLRYILTVHDIIPLLGRDLVSTLYKQQFNFALGKALDLADKIVCVSKWTYQTLLDFYPKYEDKLYLIANGVSKLSKKNIISPFVRGEKVRLLCVSRWEKYKRLELLIKALEILPTEFELTLVTDKKGFDILSDYSKTSTKKLRHTILSNIAQIELNRIYQMIDVYVQPSLMEGFCLPAAEALSYGIPIVCQQGCAIEEFTPDPIRFDVCTENPEDWANAIVQASLIERTHQFYNRVEKAISDKPSWNESAKNLKKLYNDF